MMEVKYLTHMGDDLMVVNCAKVSFDKHLTSMSISGNRLIKYLARHGHWTPFAHPHVQFFIEAPIFVARQLFRHQVGFVVNEVSRRYVDDDVVLYAPDPDEWRGRPKNAKQGSSDIKIHVSDRLINSHYGGSLELYELLLSKGIAPEQARMVLPQSMITKWIWTSSLLGYARLCKQRLDSHAQEETRVIASEISKVMLRLFPLSWKALMEHSLDPERQFSDGVFDWKEEV